MQKEFEKAFWTEYSPMCRTFFLPPWMLCHPSAQWTISRLFCKALRTAILPFWILLGMLQRWSRKHDRTSLSQTKRKCLVHLRLKTGYKYFSSIMALDLEALERAILKRCPVVHPSSTCYYPNQFLPKSHHTTPARFSHDIRSLIRKKNRLFKRSCSTKSPVNLSQSQE